MPESTQTADQGIQCTVTSKLYEALYITGQASYLARTLSGGNEIRMRIKTIQADLVKILRGLENG